VNDEGTDEDTQRREGCGKAEHQHADRTAGNRQEEDDAADGAKDEKEMNVRRASDGRSVHCQTKADVTACQSQQDENPKNANQIAHRSPAGDYEIRAASQSTSSSRPKSRKKVNEAMMLGLSSGIRKACRQAISVDSQSSEPMVRRTRARMTDRNGRLD